LIGTPNPHGFAWTEVCVLRVLLFLLVYRVGQKSKVLYCRVVTSSIMDRFKEISLLESLLNFQKKMHVIFATYLQNAITLPCRMANNVRAHLEFCRPQDQTLISTCIEKLTV